MPSHERLREKIVSQKTPRIAGPIQTHAKRLKLGIPALCEKKKQKQKQTQKRRALTKFGVKF